MALATKKNCQRVLAASLRVVSAMTGNPPLELFQCPRGHSVVKNTGGGAGSIVWGLGFWLGKIFWGSSKILIWTIVRG